VHEFVCLDVYVRRPQGSSCRRARDVFYQVGFERGGFGLSKWLPESRTSKVYTHNGVDTNHDDQDRTLVLVAIQYR
jgi:hypothetical protein